MQARMLSHGQPGKCLEAFLFQRHWIVSYLQASAQPRTRENKKIAKSWQKLSEVAVASPGQSESELILLCNVQGESPRRRECYGPFQYAKRAEFSESRFKCSA